MSAAIDSHGFEAMLLRWAETSNGGATIVLQLADPADLDHFKSMTLAKKGMVGQRLMVGVAEVGDDEQPAAPGGKGGPLAKLAGMWCADAVFHGWLSRSFQAAWICLTPITEGDETRAAAVVRHVCEVKSRADLDHDPLAKSKFDLLIRIPYSTYLKEQTLG